MTRSPTNIIGQYVIIDDDEPSTGTGLRGTIRATCRTRREAERMIRDSAADTFDPAQGVDGLAEWGSNAYICKVVAVVRPVPVVKVTMKLKNIGGKR